eukprot:883436-Pyramimonas_sp.AAC.1
MGLRKAPLGGFETLTCLRLSAHMGAVSQMLRRMWPSPLTPLEVHGRICTAKTSEGPKESFSQRCLVRWLHARAANERRGLCAHLEERSRECMPGAGTNHGRETIIYLERGPIAGGKRAYTWSGGQSPWCECELGPGWLGWLRAVSLPSSSRLTEDWCNIVGLTYRTSSQIHVRFYVECFCQGLE